MKKYLLIIVSIIIFPTIVLAAVFNSSQVGSAPSNGYVLQTNGSISTWVATSSLKISGGIGWASTTLPVPDNESITFTGQNTVMSGNATSPQIDIFGGGYAHFQTSVNTPYGALYHYMINRDTSTGSVGCLYFGNDKTTLGAPLAATTGVGGLCFAGSNWNTPGFNALRPNGLALYADSGPLTIGSGSTNAASSSIYFQAGSGLDQSYDMILTGGTGLLGIGTTTPWGRLSVSNTSTSTQPYLVIASTTGSTNTTLVLVDRQGSVTFGNNGLTYNAPTATTTISNLNMGTMSFDNDAGVVQWTDLPIVSASNNTKQSYTASVGGVPLLTVFGYSNGSGVKNQSMGVGIGTTTPYALLSIVNNSNLVGGFDFASSTIEFAIASTSVTLATTTHFMIDRIGNIYASSTAPTLSNATWAVTGDNTHGTINASASPATVTFANGGYIGVPTCLISEQTMSVVNALSYTTTATALTISQTALSGNIDYICMGHAPK